MKKLLLLCLFFVFGIWFAVFNFKGLANQGEFSSIILDFREDIPAVAIAKDLKEISSQYNEKAILNSAFSVKDNIYIVEGDKTLLKALKRSPIAKNTEYIEPNYVYGIPKNETWNCGVKTKSIAQINNNSFNAPNDPLYSQQWNLQKVNVEQAWEQSKGDGVVVAVIDTGVSRVPDLKQTNFVKGYDFVNDKENAADDHGHGTHVAGTIAQSTNNNYGVAGIAYKAKIMPLKVLARSGGGTVADIAEAIRFAADNGAAVINMSLGGGGESQIMKEAIDYAFAKNVAIVAAAGNSNKNASAYPARYPKVLSVASIGATGKKSSFSNYGAGVDISAPGGDNDAKVLQETIDPRNGNPVFAGFMGTSMASPHVAGVAALIENAGVSDPEEVYSVLKNSSLKIKEDPLNYYGAGQLDAAAAVKLAIRGKITWNDFVRWLRDNGYLNPRFWFDGGAVALLPKIVMVIVGYLLAWFLRNYLPFGWALNSGIVMGSAGIFFLKGFYIFDLPQWPFRLMGSSIPELGNTVIGSVQLNPFFASVLIPFILLALLLSHPQGKWFAIGTTLGISGCLAVSAFVSPVLWGIGEGTLAQSFLIVNALLCFGLAYVASKGEKQTA